MCRRNLPGRRRRFHRPSSFGFSLPMWRARSSGSCLQSPARRRITADTGTPPVSARQAETCLNAIDAGALPAGSGRAYGRSWATPIAPIAGRASISSILLDWLACFGARRVVLALGHRAEAITEHTTQRARGSDHDRDRCRAAAARHRRACVQRPPLRPGSSRWQARFTLTCVDFTNTIAAPRGGRHKFADAGRYGRVQVDTAWRHYRLCREGTRISRSSGECGYVFSFGGVPRRRRLGDSHFVGEGVRARAASFLCRLRRMR